MRRLWRVPPEAADLGFHRLPVELGLPESEVGLTDFAADSPRGYSKVVRSSAIRCVGHKQRQHNFGDAAVEEYFGYLKTEFFWPSHYLIDLLFCLTIDIESGLLDRLHLFLWYCIWLL